MVELEIKKNEDVKMLAAMQKDFAEFEGTFFAPSHVIWSTLSEKFKVSINQDGIGDVQSLEFNNNLGSISGYGSPITPGRTTDFDSALWSMWNHIRIRDRFGITERTTPLETTDAFTLNTERIAGRPIMRRKQYKLNWDYVFALDTLISISEHMPEIFSEPLSVCELGAGWGRLPFYLLQINPNIRYHVFDIPTTLAVAYSYTSRNGLNVLPYEESRNFSGLAMQSPGVSFMVSGMLGRTKGKQFDLFINQASFQEMAIKQVETYYSLIDKTSNAFYSFQRYRDLEMDYALYPEPQNWVKLYDRDSSFNPIWFERFYKIQ